MAKPAADQTSVDVLLERLDISAMSVAPTWLMMQLLACVEVWLCMVAARCRAPCVLCVAVIYVACAVFDTCTVCVHYSVVSRV